MALGVERVGVGFGDDADAGPTGVAQHDDAGVIAGEGLPQQVVGADQRPQVAHVVAELADLGSSLVDEAQMPLGDTDRSRPEVRIAGTGRDGRGHGRSIEIETVRAHQQVQTG